MAPTAPLSRGTSGWLLVLFLVVHWLGHIALYRLASWWWPWIEDAFKDATIARIRNCRRLIRCLVYCSLVGVMGVALWIVFYHHYPHDLLRVWNVPLAVGFHFCCAHWIFAVAEDFVCGDAITEHLKLTPEQLPYASVYRISLCSHHILAFTCYIWSMETQLLSLLGVIGMCFEVPVILITYRELVECIRLSVGSTSKSALALDLKLFWTAQFSLWHTFRTCPCLLYPISLIWWNHYLTLLPRSSFVAYNVFCVLFIFGNARVYLEVLLPARRLDMVIPVEKEGASVPTTTE
jgi:hypothetical protein